MYFWINLKSLRFRLRFELQKVLLHSNDIKLQLKESSSDILDSHKSDAFSDFKIKIKSMTNVSSDNKSSQSSEVVLLI